MMAATVECVKRPRGPGQDGALTLPRDASRGVFRPEDAENQMTVDLSGERHIAV